MPLRQRATRALRRLFRLCGPSRSPSPTPSSHPLAEQHQTRPAETGQGEPEATSSFSNADQHRSPKLEHGNAPAVHASQEISEGTPGEAATAVPFPDPHSKAYQETSIPSTSQLSDDVPTRASTSNSNPTSTWYMAIKATVDLVVQVSDVFPPLKSAAAGVKGLMDVYDVSGPSLRRCRVLNSLQGFLQQSRRIRETFGEAQDIGYDSERPVDTSPRDSRSSGRAGTVSLSSL